MKAKEPIATYYTPSMVNALQRSIVNRVSQETNPEKLTAISRILDDSPAKESFEERYQRAKTFAYKNFDKDYVQSLEARNFLVDEPFPAEICETKEDLGRIIAESEASGECTQEEVDRMFARWKSILLRTGVFGNFSAGENPFPGRERNKRVTYYIGIGGAGCEIFFAGERLQNKKIYLPLHRKNH